MLILDNNNSPLGISMQNWIDKANNLIEALPYIRKFYGKTVVIKYGGAAMTNLAQVKNVMRDVALLHFCGMRPIIVHGGGPEISELCQRLSIPTQFQHGLRITDEKTMEIAQMVLLGKINATLVTALNQNGVKTVGLSGHDGQFLQAKKLTHLPENPQQTIDLGFVGDVAEIDITLINTLLAANFLPVISPVGVDADGQAFNINADTVAGAIAGALAAEKLVLLSDVNGLYENPKDASTRMSSLKVEAIIALIHAGHISGGMLPKLKACVQALMQGVGKAHILDGKTEHSILLEIFTDEGVGTMITQ